MERAQHDELPAPVVPREVDGRRRALPLRRRRATAADGIKLPGNGLLDGEAGEDHRSTRNSMVVLGGAGLGRSVLAVVEAER